MGKYESYLLKQAAISQMEKDLNQRTQDVKERDKEVCTWERLTVTAIFSFYYVTRAACCCLNTNESRQWTFMPLQNWIIVKNSSRKKLSAVC